MVPVEPLPLRVWRKTPTPSHICLGSIVISDGGFSSTPSRPPVGSGEGGEERGRFLFTFPGTEKEPVCRDTTGEPSHCKPWTVRSVVLLPRYRRPHGRPGSVVEPFRPLSRQSRFCLPRAGTHLLLDLGVCLRLSLSSGVGAGSRSGGWGVRRPDVPSFPQRPQTYPRDLYSRPRSETSSFHCPAPVTR